MVDAVDWVDVLSSQRPEANDLSLDTTAVIFQGPKKSEIQRIYMCMIDVLCTLYDRTYLFSVDMCASYILEFAS